MNALRAFLRRDGWVALLLCIAATFVTFEAGKSEGFTRDEGVYFDAAEMYWGWYGDLGDAIASGHPLRALSPSEIQRWWSYNSEHPALMKTLYAWSWRWLHKCDCPRQGGLHPVNYSRRHRTLGVLSESEAMRLPADLFAGWMVALVYLFGAGAWNRRTGLVAAVLSLAAPHFFFNAELSCFDAPMATTWLFAIYAYWRSLTDGKWAKWAGVAIGLAIATKHNGFFLPFVVGAHWVWTAVADRRRGVKLRFPWAFVAMAIGGPLIEFVTWPWLWVDTWRHFNDYLAFHLHHVYYNIEYLGTNYNKPPFPKSYTLVTTLLSLPATTIALSLVGTGCLIKQARVPAATQQNARDTWPGLLVGMNALFPMCIIAFTGAPIFGGTKHWLPSIPFIALLAGVGADRLCDLAVEQLRLSARNEAIAGALAVALACAPAVAETRRSHPYGLSFYNLLAGGPAGGADLGMNRQFWGYATRGILPWLDEHAPPNAPVYWHDANQLMLNMDMRERLLRRDIGNTPLEEPGVRASQLAMVIHEMHFRKYEYWIWDFYHSTRPSLVLTDEGVPLVTVYERPRAP